MKIVFVGPSLPNAHQLAGTGIKVRPPAIQGDLRRAVDEGATAIGLIDGAFEYVAPVWHKEILFGLANGVTIYGAASMGALRAAECQAFGMIGVGEIFRGYASGGLVDDADVALLHGPEEVNYVAVTLPLVNVTATLARCRRKDVICAQEERWIAESANALFFKARTWVAIVERCGEIEPLRLAELLTILKTQYVDQKRLDALSLIEALRQTSQPSAVPSFDFNRTSLWREH
ncbi:TfuA-like protein [Neorhizobium alkalisoli]|uniref:TfuA-like protein n=1 Tax=Neorhizobium alkalisoli TaxID=528178 RepID=UPI000CFA18BA|nr:TfuA-like protein [Neorhizobium alkalisoli]